MADLDAPETYRRLDPSGMRGRMSSLDQQCWEAWQAARSLTLPQAYRSAKQVVVAGMGGSAIGGDLVSDLLSLENAPPIVCWRDYGLPQWAGEDTLVVVSSYSGETEESLSAFRAALERGCKAVAVTSGGRLRALALENGVPLLPITFKGEPRSAVGWSLLGLLGLLQGLSLCTDKEESVKEAVGVLQGLAARYGSTEEAKVMARRLQDRLVVIYGAGILQAVARRWKTQINENAKAWAFAEALPELNHNSIVGLPLPRVLKGRARVILLLAPDFTHPRVTLRFQITQDILAKEGVQAEEVRAEGKGPLAQVLSTLCLGDWVSYYLALLYDADPSPVPVIDYLKAALTRAAQAPEL
ncbi:MAG: bifunctional phosphoglucose/phosphomannose isomerase [Chloroflexi bacterium]|nr:bifunctional phosphoglucose/phosphomannose isomerase [Chloroflexota bacterium]